MTTILVVDDHKTLRYVMRRILQLDGHDVLIAENGWEALEILREQRVDAVVSDIHMPDIGGLEFIRRLNHLGDETPVVVVTGGGWSSPGRLLEKATSVGAAATLAKPFGAHELMDAVQGVLGESGGLT